MLSPEKVRETLSSRLTKCVAAYKMALDGVSSLDPYLDRSIYLDCSFDVLERCVRKTVEDFLGQVSQEHRGHTTAAVDLNQIDSGLYSLSTIFETKGGGYPRNRLRSDMVDRKVSIDEALETILKKIDASALTAAINEQAAGLVDQGLTEAANKLVDRFGLHREGHSFHGSVTATSRWVVVQTYDYGRAYDRSQDWRSVAAAVKVFRSEAGLDEPIESGFVELAHANDRLGYDQKVPSRSKFGDGRSVMVQCFKDKVKVHFTPEVYNSLIAFAQAYGTKTLTAAAVASTAIAA